MSPLVTIQIPTYNQKQYIKDALTSALQQTYENLQIIVADDCSPGYDIFEYLKEYKDNPKVIIHRNEKNLGRVGNYRNTLYKLVKGEWFVNLDGDDYFTDPNFVSYAVQSINIAQSEIAVFQANALVDRLSTLNIPSRKIYDSTFVVKGTDYLSCLHRGLGFTHASFVFNTSKAKESNFYNIDILDADFFSFLKILKNGHIIFCSHKNYHWREHDDQATWTLTYAKVIDKYQALADLKSHYSDIPANATKKMFPVLQLNLYRQLIKCYCDEERTWSRTMQLLSKTKLSRNYFIEIARNINSLTLKI